MSNRAGLMAQAALDRVQREHAVRAAQPCEILERGRAQDAERSTRRWLIFTAAVLAAQLVALAAIAALVSAQAHEAPSGWAYEAACCSGQDCAPVADWREERGGYSVTVTTEDHHPILGDGAPVTFWVGSRDPRIKRSGDGLLHLCFRRALGGEIASGPFVLLCVYVPPGST